MNSCYSCWKILNILYFPRDVMNKCSVKLNYNLNLFSTQICSYLNIY